MRVRFTRPADADLEEIGDWIAKDDPERAASFVADLRRAAVSLSSHPKRYPLIDRTQGDRVHKMSYRDYLIFYRVIANEVHVLRVLHGSRDWMALLGSNE